MTKRVRIENADTSTWKVEVQVWAKGVEGTPDMLLRTVDAHYPCLQVEEYVHSHQYLVVREVPAA